MIRPLCLLALLAFSTSALSAEKRKDPMTEETAKAAALAGGAMECRKGTMEDIPLPDASVDVVISNGVINLSFRKRRVIGELYRVLKPGGRVSIADIVSAKQLSQSIVNDPKLWAS